LNQPFEDMRFQMGSSMIQMGCKQLFEMGQAFKFSAFESHSIQSPPHQIWLDRPICRLWQISGPGEC